MDATYLRSRLHYDADTGVFTWRKTEDRDASWNSRFAGRVAGSKNGEGYTKIKIDGCVYQAHRLAWLWAHGAMSENEIDHVNGCRSDNRIKNLREATRAENTRNRRLNSDNTTGAKGVGYIKRLRKFRARIGAFGKQRHLGVFDTAEEAHAVYCQEAEKLHGYFANHGNTE